MTTILNKEIQMILDVDPQDRTPEMIWQLGVLLEQRDRLNETKPNKN